MQDLWTSLALMLVVEGTLYALFPQPIKRALLSLVTKPDGLLRAAGLGAVCLGVGWVWLIRHP
jgi:uncharacterized protein YjeT (DUF2065 family)